LGPPPPNPLAAEMDRERAKVITMQAKKYLWSLPLLYLATAKANLHHEEKSIVTFI